MKSRSRAIKTLVVDDEPASRKGILRLLSAEDDIDVVGEARNGAEAIEMIRDLKPELVFLDVQMPEATGFDVLEAVGPKAIKAVVFVTAYDQHAVKAFEVSALDYLLKPFEDARFHTVLQRAREQLKNEADYITRILVRESGTVSFVPVDTLDWIESADYYARLHTGGKSQLVKYSLNDLEQQLDPRKFVRVHRGAIVNVAKVKEIKLDYQNKHVVVMQTGATVPLSRSRKDALEEAVVRY